MNSPFEAYLMIIYFF